LTAQSCLTLNIPLLIIFPFVNICQLGTDSNNNKIDAGVCLVDKQRERDKKKIGISVYIYTSNYYYYYNYYTHRKFFKPKKILNNNNNFLDVSFDRRADQLTCRKGTILRIDTETKRRCVY